tara:strand:- start:6520 stop:6762 length:243 start_codon:yes stop_codon:yes gene_type:complete
MPLHLDRVILGQLHAIVPEFKRHVGGPEIDFDDVVDAVVFGPAVPPVAVFELEGGQRDAGEVGGDGADCATGCGRVRTGV